MKKRHTVNSLIKEFDTTDIGVNLGVGEAAHERRRIANFVTAKHLCPTIQVLYGFLQLSRKP